jgi:hypothetical protein
MGYFAGSVDGDDITPAEDFSMPPPPGSPTGVMSGTVTDSDTGVTLEGALVGFGGHASGFPGDLAALTDADGHYTITGIVAGTYPRVFARGPGYDVSARIVSVSSSGVTPANFQIRRDWAGLSGGGRSSTSTDRISPRSAAVRTKSSTSHWGRVEQYGGLRRRCRHPEVRRGEAAGGGQRQRDRRRPTANCGDGGSAATGNFLLETSVDGVTFVAAASGTFGPANRGHLNSIPLNPGTTDNVRYVRWTALAADSVASRAAQDSLDARSWTPLSWRCTGWLPRGRPLGCRQRQALEAASPWAVSRGRRRGPTDTA